ncbi:DUF4126 family protein [Zavarzinia sp. CC-PAN008]|uniref:DUF4126 family protein n=1 Tax=Zavarzinia sp. CC-PAN008 TaxID=3243332 RepID=UPI003F743DB9
MIVLSLLIGIVAGLRTMTAPAAASWAAYLGILPLAETGLAFLGHAWAPWILTLLALGEFVADKLPFTPSRKVPIQFAARLVSGTLCGAAFGVAAGSIWLGAVAGLVGAVAGTLGGATLRQRLAAAMGRDLPAALCEDALAIGSAALIVWSAA